MTDSDFGPLPKPPSLVQVSDLFTIFRTLLSGLGGLGFGIGKFSDQELMAISGASLMTVSLLLWAGSGAWALYIRSNLRKANLASSVASAEASATATAASGKPTAVVIT